MKFIDKNNRVWEVIHKGVYAYKLERTIKKHGSTHVFKTKIPIDKVSTLLILKEND